tara:strand:+ start:286 stop:504 length:219 start_codon:yes stop_codon:yes gene_type:complete
MPKENFELEVFRKKVMDELASIKDRVRSIEADADELAWVIAELEEELVEFFEPAEDALDDERTDPEEEEEEE